MTVAPLAGFTVGVTAARRADDFAALLVRKGATVVHAPAIQSIPLADDAELQRATHAVVHRPPDVVVATTAIGFRGWMNAAESWGLGTRLLLALQRSRILTRGPKTTGAIRSTGLREEWSPTGESSVEVAEHLLAEGVSGSRIAVQLHGTSTEWAVAYDICAALRAGGAEVVTVPVYRWQAPADPAPMDRLIDTCVGGGLDALTFTSAPAVASTLSRAKATGRLEALTASMCASMVACVGAVTAAPLEKIGVPTVAPPRARLGALARYLVQELPTRASQLTVAGSHLSLRIGAVLVDGERKPVPPAGVALLRALASDPGRVVSVQELLGVLPGGSAGPHAVEAAVAGLRTALGDSTLVQTVPLRGFRLAVDAA